MNLDVGLKPSEKRKAIASRLLELTGQAKLGKGEAVRSRAERNKAPQRIRMGMERKIKEKAAKKLIEVNIY